MGDAASETLVRSNQDAVSDLPPCALRDAVHEMPRAGSRMQDAMRGTLDVGERDFAREC